MFSNKSTKEPNSEKKEKEYIISLYNIKKAKIEIFGDFIYYTNFLIGKGGTMIAFYAESKNSGVNAVIKIDKTNKKKSYILKEVNILQKLKDQNNIPYLYGFECNGKRNILIESLLGPSLNKIIRFTDSEFEISTVVIIGIQMVMVLKNLHDIGIIHNDIKPSNICWGKFINGIFDEKKNFFLIDFCCSRNFTILGSSANKNNISNQDIEKIHITDKLENSFNGTAKYMAIPISDR